MKKRSLLILLAAVSSAAAIGGVALASNAGALLPNIAGEAQYGLTLNAANRVTGLVEGAGTTEINTGLGNPITFAYTGASTIEGKHVALATGGTIINKDLVSGIEAVKATFSGALDIYGSPEGAEFTKLGTLVGGEKFTFDKTWDVIKIVATAESSIDSIEVSHSCVTRFTVEQDKRIVGFDAAVNTARRGWGTNYWWIGNLGWSEGGRFHFYSEVGGEHDIVFEANSQLGAKMATYLNGVKGEDYILPATGHWYEAATPTGTNVTMKMNLAQGWNELIFCKAVDKYVSDTNYIQVGAMTMKARTDRRYDPAELNVEVNKITLEAEQGNGMSKNGAWTRFEKSNCSGGMLLGGIEANGCGSEMTFNVPNGQAGDYVLTPKVGCGANTTLKVYVDDMVNEWPEGCTTTEYTITQADASPSWDQPIAVANPVTVHLDNGWNRVRVLFGGQWFTLDCVELTKVVK